MASRDTEQSGRGTSHRGFAAMDQEKQRAIASKGGKAAHQAGTAHEFTAEEAREAGRKGGQAVSQNRAHMAEIGRQGGHARGSRASERAARGSSHPPKREESEHEPNEGETTVENESESEDESGEEG